jgi:3-oxoacyl-[acyl-carrier protein] reductase
MRRFARPEEIAAVVFFLASPDASYMTGLALKLDGALV